MINKEVPSVDHLIEAKNTVVDCGCYGWSLVDHCRLVGAKLIGVDQDKPSQIPPNVEFVMIRNLSIELESGIADVVVASHILEHIHEPITFMRELVRITRPGGLIWIEAPSELATMMMGSSDPEDHSFQNFWDDPTHVRPWPPGAMYRLALSCQCRPEAISRCHVDGIPSTRMICRKDVHYDDNLSQSPRYVSLRGVARGVENAWNHIWVQKR